MALALLTKRFVMIDLNFFSSAREFTCVFYRLFRKYFRNSSPFHGRLYKYCASTPRTETPEEEKNLVLTFQGLLNKEPPNQTLSIQNESPFSSFPNPLLVFFGMYTIPRYPDIVFMIPKLSWLCKCYIPILETPQFQTLHKTLRWRWWRRKSSWKGWRYPLKPEPAKIKLD